MPTITEDRLTFDFPGTWVALKYDEPAGFYKQLIDRNFIDIKAVDIVAADSVAGRLVLLEVKDFRGYAVANRRRITSGELAEEVGQKFLHTLSALYLGLRLGQPEFAPLRGYVLPPPEHLDVVLFLEEDTAGLSRIQKQNQRTNRQNLLTKLKTMFKPLKIKVHLYDRASVPARAGWTVA
ncbi:hypothetical protein [Hymenobacter sp. DG01]|uniref:hypothetical protein n=1 Tax=Hymenobacter sp. DG01 TaxID=2584940 RepID=UPI0011236368|nr:hypothetical protein [Hymenobacter sp. DG01]